MPKVIFRPNATPPPFVPPTPPIDEDSVKFTPSSFSEGQTINATLYNVSLSEDHDSFSLYFILIGSGLVESSSFTNSDEVIEQLTVSFVAPCDSNRINEVGMTLYNEGDISGSLILNIVE